MRRQTQKAKKDSKLSLIALPTVVVVMFCMTFSVDAKSKYSKGCNSKSCMTRVCDTRVCKTRVLYKKLAREARYSWAIPAKIVECESHFKNLPPNKAGASGYYQIIPSTWKGYGGLAYAPAAYLAPKWAQDRIAGRILRTAGINQWDCTKLV